MSSALRCMAFDFGLKKMGLAVGQNITFKAQPVGIIPAGDLLDWSLVLSHVSKWRPNVLLVGLPVNMDETESELSTEARAFAAELEAKTGLPLHLVDERLSTREARVQAEAAGVKPNEPIDDWAAKVICETWLSTLSTEI